MNREVEAVSLSAQIACAMRELQRRQKIFGGLVKEGKLRPEMARRELREQSAILRTLQCLERLSGARDDAARNQA